MDPRFPGNGGFRKFKKFVWLRRVSLHRVQLRENELLSKTILACLSGAQMASIHKIKKCQKISWHCPFNKNKQHVFMKYFLYKTSGTAFFYFYGHLLLYCCWRWWWWLVMCRRRRRRRRTSTGAAGRAPPGSAPASTTPTIPSPTWPTGWDHLLALYYVFLRTHFLWGTFEGGGGGCSVTL